MSSRPNTPYRPCLCSHGVSKTDMEGQAPDTWHQASFIPDTCFVCVTICHRHLDLTVSWCQDSGCFPPEVSETAAWNPMVRPSPKWWSRLLQWTGLTSLSHLLSRRLISVFGHMARFDDVTQANMALQLHINVSLNRPTNRTWRRPPGCPRNKWLDQLRNNSTRLIRDLWRRADDRRHGGATTRWHSLFLIKLLIVIPVNKYTFSTYAAAYCEFINMYIV